MAVPTTPVRERNPKLAGYGHCEGMRGLYGLRNFYASLNSQHRSYDTIKIKGFTRNAFSAYEYEGILNPQLSIDARIDIYKETMKA